MALRRILSLDGGGIRGIVTAVLLESLSRKEGLEGWLDSVDLFAGTSTGALLALGLAHGLPPGRIRALYEKRGARIFADSLIDDAADLGKTLGADYGTKNLRRELRDLFGADTTLGQLKKRVLITSFDLDNESPFPQERTWKPKLFHNLPGKNSDAGRLAWQVGLYTTVAPTYFPSVDGYVDGGVYANNPAMCALAQSQDSRYGKVPPLKDVALLSVGTGASLLYIRGKRHDWGIAQWSRHIITLMMEGTAGIADYQCRQMLGKKYHRLQPSFPPGRSVPLDAVGDIDYLIDFAGRHDIEETAAWLRTQWL